MDKELKVAIARNLLEEKTCNSCDKQSFFFFFLGKTYGTCRRWKEYQEPSFAINSYSFSVKPRKLNISWTKLSEEVINKQFEVNLLEDNEFATYKHLEEWKDKGALQVLAEKSCTKCIKADNCKKQELNELGLCDEYEYFDGSAESVLMKAVSEELKKEMDKGIKCRN